MASISSLMSSTSTYETFVQQLVQIESQKKLLMEVEQKDNKEKQQALGAVSSAISEFESTIEELTTSNNNSFQPFSSSTSDESVVKVDSVSGIDRPSDFNITIDRLATNDIALSQVKTGTDTDLSGFGDGEVTLTIGDKTETISISSTKDDGAGGQTARTNEEILEAFASEVSSLFGDEARASVFQTDDSNVQLSIQSLSTGFDERVQLSGATGVLAEVTNNMTHLTAENELDASFTVDGVTFTRGENTVSDAIEGVTFTMLEANGQQETMNIDRDVDKAEENVKSFIEKFNKLNSTINNRTFINPDSGNKGPLQGMRSIRNLSLNLRQIGMLSDSTIPDGEIASLAQLGITFKNNGDMELEDSDLLQEALLNNPEQVTSFFESAGSPIATMKERAEAYTESDGIMSSLEDGLDAKMDRLDRRIEREEKYLEEYEIKQRQIFNELDLLLEQGQAQFDQVANFVYSY